MKMERIYIPMEQTFLQGNIGAHKNTYSGTGAIS